MAVAEAGDGGAAGGVDVGLAGGVGDRHAAAAHGDRQRRRDASMEDAASSHDAALARLPIDAAAGELRFVALKRRRGLPDRRCATTSAASISATAKAGEVT